jgi:hypothetical protein
MCRKLFDMSYFSDDGFQFHPTQLLWGGGTPRPLPVILTE